MDAISWAWMLEGCFALKKFGLASFCSPAKQKVTPRKARVDAHREGQGPGGGRRKTDSAAGVGRMGGLLAAVPWHLLASFVVTRRFSLVVEAMPRDSWTHYGPASSNSLRC